MKKILVTGVFDVLHIEHERFLRKAKELGDALVVGIESDARVKKLKGEGRPINPQQQRKSNLEKLDIADEVVILPEDFGKLQSRRAFLQTIHPDVLAVSSHSPHIEEKLRLMQEIGGTLVIVHEHNPEISTTQLLENQKVD